MEVCVWMMLASRIQQVVFCILRMTEWRIISPIWTFLPPDTDLTMLHRLYFWAILTCMYYIVKLGYLLLGAINFFASIKIHPYILSTGTKYPFLLRGLEGGEGEGVRRLDNSDHTLFSESLKCREPMINI